MLIREHVTLTCMVNVLLAATDGAVALRILAAVGGLSAAILSQRWHRQESIGNSAYVVELAVARLSLVPLLIDVVYAQTAIHPSLRTGEAFAAIIVAIAPFGVKFESDEQTTTSLGVSQGPY